MTVCIGSTPLLQNIPRCLSRRSFPLGVLEIIIIIINIMKKVDKNRIYRQIEDGQNG